MAGYMRYPIVQNYYNSLTKDSHEWKVDRLWNTILNLYFTAAEDFGVEIQPRPAPNVSKEANDVTVAYVHHVSNKRKALCLWENKRREFEGQTAVWTKAVTELTNYMIKERQASRQMGEIIFGAVTVGRYTRFYVLSPGSTALEDYPGTNGTPFEFRKDEDMIVKILREIKATVSRPSTPASRPPSRSSNTAASRPPSRSSNTAASRPPSRSGGQ
ncbi:uncharacterized protein P884DRAFT_321012 [Thermothelomyces heterothallicus CBS 202.75]|uniref:uncharacterized protein n=1 Tax=Thermothelomyces heterothallicus CBS 202.75 TaxID=1149848 RepID=UPI0037420A35